MTVLYLIYALILCSCNYNEKKSSNIQQTVEQVSTTGDTVKQLGDNIMSIYQDKKNNYWFGSWQDGLYKFTGTTIIHYSTKHGLPSNRVEEIKEDNHGNIYINTSKGILKYNELYFTKLQESNFNTDNWSLTPNDIWFKNFTNAAFVYRYDGNRLYKLQLPKIEIGEDWIKKNPNNTNPYAVYCTYKDSKGNIWFGTAALGALRYDGKSFNWITENDVTELHNGPSNGVRSIMEDKDGYFWFNTEYKYKIHNTTRATIRKIDSTKFYNRIKNIGSLDRKRADNLNEFLSIIKDNDKKLWIALYLHGVYTFDGITTKHFPILVEGKNIPIFCLYKDNRGVIWLGSHQNGAYKFNGKGFEKFSAL